MKWMTFKVSSLWGQTFVCQANKTKLLYSVYYYVSLCILCIQWEYAWSFKGYYWPQESQIKGSSFKIYQL